MRPDIEQAIRKDQADTDKQLARAKRGWGNSHRLGAAYDTIDWKATEDTTDPSGDPDLQVCPECGCPTEGWCPKHHEVQTISQLEFEARLDRERMQARTEEVAKPKPRRTVHDNVNIQSDASGCMREQVPEFNRLFGHMGATYLPNGKVVYKDTAAQRRVLTARGMFLKNDTRSPRNA